MKKFVSIIMSILMLLQFAAVCVNAEDNKEYSVGTKPISEIIKSKDGKYGYVINSKNNEAYFAASYEDNLSVLNIPEYIDGNKIVGTIRGYAKSFCTIRQINFSKYITDIYSGGLSFSRLPTCKINLNEGLKVIHTGAYWDHYDSYGDNYYLYYDELIFPSTLTEIQMGSIPLNIRKMVFKGNPKIDMSLWWDTYYSYKQNMGSYIDAYFMGDATNVAADAFMVYDFNGEIAATSYSRYHITIHYTKGAKGFEKFKEKGYKTKIFDGKYPQQSVKQIPVTKITADNIKITTGKAYQKNINAKVYPENATDKRIWYFPLTDTYRIMKVNVNGRIGSVNTSNIPANGNTVKVRAVASNGKYKDITISVKGLNPPKVTLTNINATTIKIAWNKVVNATGYYIWFYDYGTKKNKHITTVNNAKTTSYTVKGLNTGETYTFKVKARAKSSDMNSASTLCELKTKLATPVLKISIPGKTYAKLTWNKISGANGYYIFVCSKYYGRYQLCGTIQGGGTTSMTYKNLNPQHKYYFKIVARCPKGAGNSSSSNIVCK